MPSIATAILQSGLLPDDFVMEAVSYGGAAPPKRLAADVKKRFPDAFIVSHHRAFPADAARTTAGV